MRDDQWLLGLLKPAWHSTQRPFKDVALLGHPFEFGLKVPLLLGLGKFFLPLTRGQLLLLHSRVQALGAVPKPGRNLYHRVTSFDDLADRFNLEFFWKKDARI